VVDAYYKEVGFGLNSQLKSQGQSFHSTNWLVFIWIFTYILQNFSIFDSKVRLQC
jgi:hypothetical protein